VATKKDSNKVANAKANNIAIFEVNWESIAIDSKTRPSESSYRLLLPAAVAKPKSEPREASEVEEKLQTKESSKN